LEHRDELVITLAMDRLEMHMDEVARGPCFASKCPFVVVTEYSLAIPAIVDGILFLICRHKTAAALNAVLEWLYGWKLAEVAGHDDLDASKWRTARAANFHDLVQSLKMQVLHHADFIDDDGVGLHEALAGSFSARGLSQEIELSLVVVWRPSRKGPGGCAVDGQGDLARGRHDADLLSHFSETCPNGMQDGGFAAASGPGVEDVASASCKLNQLQLLRAEHWLCLWLGLRDVWWDGCCCIRCLPRSKEGRGWKSVDVWGFVCSRPRFELAQAE
jgi:hypothetical protein